MTFRLLNDFDSDSDMGRIIDFYLCVTVAVQHASFGVGIRSCKAKLSCARPSAHAGMRSSTVDAEDAPNPPDMA
jgi:hypothetical protein